MSSRLRTGESPTCSVHVAHFYDELDAHVDHVADYLADALVGGGGALIVAVPGVTDQLRNAMAARGVDVEAALGSGRLNVLDAEVTLSQIQHDTVLDIDAFDAIARAAVESVSVVNGLWVYGELVNLLWEAGDVRGAIEIEDCWTRLAHEHGFSLLCGYHAVDMSPAQIKGFDDLCARHSGLVGGPPGIPGADHSRRFPKSPSALRPARRFVADTLSALGLDDLVPDATLVVGELATNAIVHARSDFNVALTRLDRGIRLSVSDAGRVVPRATRRASDSIGGHGLHVVAELASASGHDLVPGGKVTWAQLDVGMTEPGVV